MSTKSSLLYWYYKRLADLHVYTDCYDDTLHASMDIMDRELFNFWLGNVNSHRAPNNASWWLKWWKR